VIHWLLILLSQEQHHIAVTPSSLGENAFAAELTNGHSLSIDLALEFFAKI
jgi:hypothetical protein